MGAASDKLGSGPNSAAAHQAQQQAAGAQSAQGKMQNGGKGTYGTPATGPVNSGPPSPSIDSSPYDTDLP